MLTIEQKWLLEEVAKFRKPTREALFSAKARPVSILTKQGKKIIEQLLIYDMLGLDKDGDTWTAHTCLVFDILSEKGKCAVEAIEMQHHDRVNGLPISEWIPVNRALPLRYPDLNKEQEGGFWVVELKNNPYFSNGHLVLKSDPPAGSNVLEEKPKFKPILREAEASRNSQGRVIGFSYDGQIERDVIWIQAERVIDCKNLSLHDSLGLDRILHKLDSEILSMRVRIILIIDSVYYDYALKKYPEATFGLLGWKSIVGIFDNDKLVGAVMPVVYKDIPEKIQKLRHRF